VSEPADVFLARNLGRISRKPPEAPIEEIREIEVVDDMILEMALERLEAIEDFTPAEMDFFQRGEEEAAIAQLTVDDAAPPPITA
jgi:hypothetical protein